MGSQRFGEIFTQHTPRFVLSYYSSNNVAKYNTKPPGEQGVVGAPEGGPITDEQGLQTSDRNTY